MLKTANEMNMTAQVTLKEARIRTIENTLRYVENYLENRIESRAKQGGFCLGVTVPPALDVDTVVSAMIDAGYTVRSTIWGDLSISWGK